MKYLRVLIAAAFVFVSAPMGCAQPRVVDGVPIPSHEAAVMPDLIRLYDTDESYISRFARVGWSSDRQGRLGGFYEEWLARLDALDYAALSPTDRIDFHLLRNAVEWSISGLALERRRLAEIDPVMPFRQAVQDLELSRRRMEPCDPEVAAGVLAGVAAQAKQSREQLVADKKKGDETSPEGLRLSAAAAQRAAGIIDDLSRVLADWSRFYQDFAPDFQWWTRVPREEAQRELSDLSKYLREDIAGLKGKDEDPLVGDPIGREALLADIKGEMLAYSPEELVKIGEAELAWCEEQMKVVAAEAGFPDDWKQALAKVKDAHVPPGEQAALVRDEARAMIARLKERDLVTIPPLCEQLWRVEMHSVETQRTLPYAVYGGQYMGVSYAAESMSHEHKLMAMRGNNRHFTHIVTPHELIPGHHLQGYYAARERAYRRTFSTPFLVEGWALYWEMRLWDTGWAGATGQDEAMDRIGMLFWRMHRAARIIVSLKFHLGEMSPGEMVDFLVDRVGHERSGATAEVRRYIGGDYSPLYQCGYMIGGLQLSALRQELVVPGTMTEKQFNDAVLGQNSIPIEMIRAALLHQRLEKDWEPSWKFIKTEK